MSQTKAAVLTRRERVEQREKAVLNAARALFQEYGCDNVPMSEIAKQAQISEGSIYSYYKTRHDLMQAVVVDFWNDIAERARAAIPEAAHPFEQMQALAEFHLYCIIDNFDFLDLSFELRRKGKNLSGAQDKGQRLAVSREQVRYYTTVFDEIFRRAVDRGELRQDATLWLVRDMFYGTLEYSARTMVGRNTPDRGDAALVVANVLDLIKKTYAADKPAPPAPVLDEASPSTVPERLERVAARFEAAIEKIGALE